MNGGIKVRYSDYEAFAKEYKKSLLEYKDWMQRYLDYLDFCCNNAIVSGQVHEALEGFRQELNKSIDMPETIAISVEKIINEYLDDLDSAQKVNGVNILYDRDYKGYKDYTWAYFNSLESMAESTNYNCDGLHSFFDLLEDTWYGIGKFFGIYNNSKEEKIKKTHAAMLQYNDVTKRQLNNIKRRIGVADEKCKENLLVVLEFINNMEAYISVFKEIMVNSQYSPSQIHIASVDFATKYSAMRKSYNSVLILDTITDEDVENFINSDGAEDFMDEQVHVVYDYLADLSQIEVSDFDFWKIVIFQMFDIAEGQITSGWQYDKLIMKKELTEMLDDLAENYVYSGSDEQETLNMIESFVKLAEEHGTNLYKELNSMRDIDGKKILDGRTKKAKEFLGFLDSLENAEKILKYGEKGIEVLTKLFIDYEKNLAFLDSFEKNARLSDEMMACFQELRATYEHELLQAAKEAGQVIVECGVEALYSLSIGKMVGSVKETIGLIGDLTGENAQTAARIELLNYGHDVVDASQTAFMESMEKLKAASKEDEDYEILMNDFKNCFTIYKNSLKRMFEKMALAAEGAERDYFYYCAAEVSSASLKEFSNLQVMSYDDYLKNGYAC